jgi:hypothetical protein
VKTFIFDFFPELACGGIYVRQAKYFIKLVNESPCSNLFIIRCELKARRGERSFPHHLTVGYAILTCS